ncbi:Secreted RxLR effector protein 78 [Cardamine amara subsp. amara]|uniref:Secreted RxLR effector protein 78 n=1 Tax=Cardamine amara subsp. amara TaxID=228776 RepID=A0ABD1BR46_CARAN
MSDTFFWNVRGVNDTSKHRPLATWINTKPVTFGAILETHVAESNMNHILSSIGQDWTALSNYQFSELGKIWIIFKKPTKIVHLFSDSQSITCEVTLEDNRTFFYTAIYASNELVDREALWISLKDTQISFNLHSKAWLVCGDFNEILSPGETSNPRIISTSSAMRKFGECLSDLGLSDMPSQGPKYTWWNKRPSDPVAKKLDRCLINDNWILDFPSSHCSFMPPLFSDHSPCHISLFTPPPSFGSRSFKFFNFLAKQPSFIPTIQRAWETAGDTVTNLRDLCYKLKILKRPLKSFSREHFSDIEKRVSDADILLQSLQVLALTNPTPITLQQEHDAHISWQALRLAEESFFRQRSRVKWMEEGDLNTRFFHLVMRVRNASNAVKYFLKQDGTRTTSLEEMHSLAVSHFTDFLTTIKGDYCCYLPQFLNHLCSTKCSTLQQAILLAPFTADVVKSTLLKLPLNKTLGPDGLTAEFFRASWEVLELEIISAVQQFFSSFFMPTCLNSTSLILIPKRPDAEELKDFRPISCLNTLYKLISRMLSDRLKRILPDIILPNHTAFVKDRLLLENVLLASEVIQGYHLSSLSPRITLKVDISKAFDLVRWDFVIRCLESYDVLFEFVRWIRACICSPSYSVFINGVTSGYFKGCSGLRQGDPISPILFVMIMNILSLMLNRASFDGIFSITQVVKSQG